MEQALERLVRRFDGDLPTGGDSHAELLERARTPIGDLRPAIISAETADNLHELRKFRHIVRRNYGGHFDYDLAAPNVRRAEHCMAALRAELSDFAFQTGMLDVRPFGPFKGVETANLGNLNQASLFFPGHAKQYPLAIGIDLKDRKQQAEICNALRTLPTEELQERLAETRTVRDYFKPLAGTSNFNREAFAAAQAGYAAVAAVLGARAPVPASMCIPFSIAPRPLWLRERFASRAGLTNSLALRATRRWRRRMAIRVLWSAWPRSTNIRKSPSSRRKTSRLPSSRSIPAMTIRKNRTHGA